MDFNNINQAQQSANNALLNSSERSQTVMLHDLQQSTFNKSFQQAGTCNSGRLIPILAQIAYPGDTYKIRSQDNIHMSLPAGTPYNSINYDVTYVFVPLLQIDENFKYRLGENDNSGIDRPFTDKLPMLHFENMTNIFSYTENDLMNYFNIPINYDFSKGAAPNLNLYFILAYIHTWNSWYREQNTQAVIDGTSWKALDGVYAKDYTSTMTYNESLKFGKGLAPVSKLPDMFTNCLPYRQKGVAISAIDFSNLVLKPLTVRNAQHPETLNLFTPQFYNSNGSTVTGTNHVAITNGKTQAYTTTGGGSYVNDIGLALKTEATADIFDGQNFPFSVNNQRESIAMQHYLEKLALTGSRYVEQLRSIWKIEIDPLEIGRPEVIGGYTQTLLINNVQQTSQTTTNSPLGKIASSLYNMVYGDEIEYTADQYGIILGLLTIRTPINNGGQGLPKQFTYQSTFDLFNPEFNGLGEQPVLNMELYLSEKLSENLSTFGYNEPWYETKTNINNANGFLSLRSKTSLFPQFLYGQKYDKDKPPRLNADFMEYKPDIIGNTLFKGSDGSTVEFFHQFTFMIDFTIYYTTSQPLYETPGVSYI